MGRKTDDGEAFAEQNAMLTEALTELERLREAVIGVLPVRRDNLGECWYCFLGNRPDSEGWHFDSNNVWNGDQRCWKSERYDALRAELGEKGEG